MTIETSTYIADWVSANPASTDQKSEGDDHIRKIKTDVQATFPGFAGRFRRIQTKSGAYTAVLNDNASILRTSNTWTLALTAAATLGNGWETIVYNDGAGVITVDPSGAETINGAATLAIEAAKYVNVWCDGTNFFAIKRSTNQLATSDYADDSVTYAKIQNVTSGRVLGRFNAGAGDIEETQCTTAGQNILAGATAAAQRSTLGSGTTGDALFLSATAAAARTTLEINPAGIHLLIAETTATSVPQLDINLSSYTSFYRNTILVIHHANPASTFPFSMRISTDGGSSFISTNTYENVGNAIVDRVTLTSNVNVGTDSSNGLYATIELVDMPNTVHKKIFHFETGFQDTGGAVKFANSASHETGIPAYNAIRLFFDTGNIDTITYSVYGRSKVA